MNTFGTILIREVIREVASFWGGVEANWRECYPMSGCGLIKDTLDAISLHEPESCVLCITPG